MSNCTGKPDCNCSNCRYPGQPGTQVSQEKSVEEIAFDLLYYLNSQSHVGDARRDQIQRVAEAITTERQRAEAAEKRVAELMSENKAIQSLLALSDTEKNIQELTHENYSLRSMLDKMEVALKHLSNIETACSPCNGRVSITLSAHRERIARKALDLWMKFKEKNQC